MRTERCEHCNGTGQQLNHRDLGKQMRKKRKRLGVSLRETAERMAISAPFLSDLERGNRHWTENLIVKFNRVINKL